MVEARGRATSLQESLIGVTISFPCTFFLAVACRLSRGLRHSSGNACVARERGLTAAGDASTKEHDTTCAAEGERSARLVTLGRLSYASSASSPFSAAAAELMMSERRVHVHTSPDYRIPGGRCPATQDEARVSQSLADKRDKKRDMMQDAIRGLSSGERIERRRVKEKEGEGGNGTQ